MIGSKGDEPVLQRLEVSLAPLSGAGNLGSLGALDRALRPPDLLQALHWPLNNASGPQDTMTGLLMSKDRGACVCGHISILASCGADGLSKCSYWKKERRAEEGRQAPRLCESRCCQSRCCCHRPCQSRQCWMGLQQHLAVHQHPSPWGWLHCRSQPCAPSCAPGVKGSAPCASGHTDSRGPFSLILCMKLASDLQRRQHARVSLAAARQAQMLAHMHLHYNSNKQQDCMESSLSIRY